VAPIRAADSAGVTATPRRQGRPGSQPQAAAPGQSRPGARGRRSRPDEPGQGLGAARRWVGSRPTSRLDCGRACRGALGRRSGAQQQRRRDQQQDRRQRHAGEHPQQAGRSIKARWIRGNDDDGRRCHGRGVEVKARTRRTLRILRRSSIADGSSHGRRCSMVASGRSVEYRSSMSTCCVVMRGVMLSPGTGRSRGNRGCCRG
jgi:hypothetical protein